MIVFFCESCEKELKTRMENLGKKFRCPHCEEIVVVPEVPVLIDLDLPIFNKVS